MPFSGVVTVALAFVVVLVAALAPAVAQQPPSPPAPTIPRPAFQGREMVDLIASVVEAAKDAGGDTAQVVPGTPG